jgi:hypothetical protein
MNFDHILHRADGTLVELNSQVGTFRAVTSERFTAVRQDVSSAELTLISSEAFTVNVGDWIQAKGIRLYCMSTIDRYTCSEDNNREYQLTFYSPEYYLRLAILYNTSESESGGVYSYSRVDNTYPSVGTFEDFVKLCCYNCNSVQGVRLFKVGTISEDIATDIRVITFSDYNCLAVMKQSCESFETTWKVRVNEDPEPDSVFIIDFGVAIEDFPVTLKVENAQGLTSIDVTASDKDVFTQFVIKGGSENLPSDYPYPNLQLDEDLESTPPILANSMIKLPDLYSRWGKSIKELTYEDIKPSRTGTVTSISENILKFTDSDLIGAAWSPVGGTIHFVSGHLIGFTFNCKDFNSTTGEITIESTEENNGFVLPSPTDSYYRINELDKYNIAGVSLPSSYITDAKAALKERALLGIDYWSQPRMQYAITIDPKIISVEIVPNMGFHIEHSALGINKVIKVQQVVYDLSKESPYDIESIIISDLKTDDSRADATHRQIATNRNIVNGTGANNVYSAKLLSRQRILDDYAKSQGLPNWGTFMEILSSGKGLWKDEDGNWWLNVAAIKAGAIGAELINVTQLIANTVIITGVQDIATPIANTAETNAKNYADNQLGEFATTVAGSVSNLQSQIDGNITTWFYAYVPTTGNAPANTWTTTALKNQHLGDLFYDTETGYCYRFQLSGETYSWVKITDTDVTKALADAAAAQDTADSKRRVFVATPTTPYDIGDLWLKSGDLYKCKVTRLTGSYVASDWEKGVKYTDDTVANAAAAAAAAAQSAADDAQDAADAANALLTNIASDSKLTASEKQAAQKEWDIIQAEKTKNDTQADLYSVSKTAYTNAYNALSSYLSTLLSNLTTTSNITGSEFRGKFKDYYNARTDLLNAISNAAAAAAVTTAASDANTKMNAAKDALAVRLGYTNYAAMAAEAAATGKLIVGGLLNANIIDVQTLVGLDGFIDYLTVKFLETVGDANGYKVQIKNSLNSEGTGESYVRLVNSDGTRKAELVFDANNVYGGSGGLPVLRITDNGCYSRIFSEGLEAVSTVSGRFSYNMLSQFTPFGMVFATGTHSSADVKGAFAWDRNSGKVAIYVNTLPRGGFGTVSEGFLYRSPDGLSNDVIRYQS